jgi:hypothetical protein
MVRKTKSKKSNSRKKSNTKKTSNCKTNCKKYIVGAVAILILVGLIYLVASSLSSLSDTNLEEGVALAGQGTSFGKMAELPNEKDNNIQISELDPLGDCFETDAGIDAYNFGELKLEFPNYRPDFRNDSCTNFPTGFDLWREAPGQLSVSYIDDPSRWDDLYDFGGHDYRLNLGRSTGENVFEWSCSTNFLPHVGLYYASYEANVIKCPLGCQDGACKPTNTIAKVSKD